MNPPHPHPGGALDPLGLVAGTAAQEIGSALTAIQVAAERLERRVSRRVGSEGRSANVGPRTAELEVILDQSHRLARLARSLVELTRPSLTDSVPVALAPEVRRLLPALRRVLAREGVELHVEGVAEESDASVGLETESDVRVRADPAALQEILLALVDNARRAVASTPGPRWIRVMVSHLPAGGGQIRVEDSGPGITPGHEERIFFPLVSEWGGRGMGLSRSRLVLAGLGGELRLARSSHGGAAFVLTLEPFPRPCPEDAPESLSEDGA